MAGGEWHQMKVRQAEERRELAMKYSSLPVLKAADKLGVPGSTLKSFIGNNGLKWPTRTAPGNKKVSDDEFQRRVKIAILGAPEELVAALGITRGSFIGWCRENDVNLGEK